MIMNSEHIVNTTPVVCTPTPTPVIMTPMNVFDDTSIIREVPKPVEPVPINDSKDETDKSILETPIMNSEHISNTATPVIMTPMNVFDITSEKRDVPKLIEPVPKNESKDETNKSVLQTPIMNSEYISNTTPVVCATTATPVITTPMNVFDVTSIIRDVPKPIEPVPINYSKDETFKSRPETPIINTEHISNTTPVVCTTTATPVIVTSMNVSDVTSIIRDGPKLIEPVSINDSKDESDKSVFQTPIMNSEHISNTTPVVCTTTTTPVIVTSINVSDVTSIKRDGPKLIEPVSINDSKDDSDKSVLETPIMNSEHISNTTPVVCTTTATPVIVTSMNVSDVTSIIRDGPKLIEPVPINDSKDETDKSVLQTPIMNSEHISNTISVVCTTTATPVIVTSMNVSDVTSIISDGPKLIEPVSINDSKEETDKSVLQTPIMNSEHISNTTPVVCTTTATPVIVTSMNVSDVTSIIKDGSKLIEPVSINDSKDDSDKSVLQTPIMNFEHISNTTPVVCATTATPVIMTPMNVFDVTSIIRNVPKPIEPVPINYSKVETYKSSHETSIINTEHISNTTPVVCTTTATPVIVTSMNVSDVTSIIRDGPKLIEPVPINDSKDETDKSVLQTPIMNSEHISNTTPVVCTTTATPVIVTLMNVSDVTSIIRDGPKLIEPVSINDSKDDSDKSVLQTPIINSEHIFNTTRVVCTTTATPVIMTPMNVFDVTSIIRDVPKPIEPVPINDSKDETYKSSLQTPIMNTEHISNTTPVVCTTTATPVIVTPMNVFGVTSIIRDVPKPFEPVPINDSKDKTDKSVLQTPIMNSEHISNTTPVVCTTTATPVIMTTMNVFDVKSIIRDVPKPIESVPINDSKDETEKSILQAPIMNSDHISNSIPVVCTATSTPVIVTPMNLSDVTSIIRDVPKPTEHFTINDSKDEIDKSVLQTDQMVLAKDNVISKVSTEKALSDPKLRLSYKPGQWAPDRPDGKKQYDKHFLLVLRNHPASKQKPDNIPDDVLRDDRKTQAAFAKLVAHAINKNLQHNLSNDDSVHDASPPEHLQSPLQTMQQVPVTHYDIQNSNLHCLSNCKSNPGIRGDKDSNKQRPKTENSCKPMHFVKGAAVSEEEIKTEALFNRVRSILNKLTLQKFDTLVNQFRKLEIDTKDRLQGVVNLVFDKAVDKPTSLVAYAMMCKELQIMQAPAGNGDDKKSVAFRTLLVTRCQSEFEKQSVDETQRNNKIKEIENCADSEKKKELSSELKDYDRRLRMKSVGCVRFLGELFKQQILTASIIRRCLQTLTDNKDEGSLECLCELLKAVGKELEFKNVDLSSFFYEIKLIVNGERQKVSTEILIMLKDVIALRDSKWAAVDKPLGSSQLFGNWGKAAGASKISQPPVSTSTNMYAALEHMVMERRLLHKPLGSSQLFGNWGKAAGASKISQPPVSTSTNMYSDLEHNMVMERRLLGQWAPDRPDGKKQYEKYFLLALRNRPASKQKPDNIPDDVLRDDQKVPRRGDTTPKTIDQTQKGAETELSNIQVMNMNTLRKDDRGSGPRGSSQRQKVTYDDGWSRNKPFTIQTDKMRAARLPSLDESLGDYQLFGSWGKAAGASKISQPPVSTSTIMYAALENMDMDRRPLNSRSNKDPYSSKGLSLERNSYKFYDGRESRSGFQHRDTGAPVRSSGPSVSPTVPKLTEEQIERRIHNSLDEYLTSCCTTDEYFEDIADSIPQSQFSKVVYESYNYVLEKSQSARLKTGELFAKLIRTGRLPLDSFITGFEELLSLWEDLVIDIPQIWQYFAEDLVHLCLEEVLSFNRLQKLLSSLISNNVGPKLLKPLFGLIVKEKGPNFLQNSWRNSGFQLSDFMSQSEVQPFIKNNNFEFLVGGEIPIDQSLLSYEEIQRKLSEFFTSNTPFDDIVNWISVNVGESVKENKFIRTLGTAIFEDSISKNKLVPEVLTGHSKLIQKYVDTNTDYELECLYALQSLAYKLKNPLGLLLSICDKLYEDSIFSQESFMAWENSADPAEQEGKNVALRQLASFFTQLKENEEDEDYSSNSEDAGEDD